MSISATSKRPALDAVMCESSLLGDTIEDSIYAQMQFTACITFRCTGYLTRNVRTYRGSAVKSASLERSTVTICAPPLLFFQSWFQYPARSADLERGGLAKACRITRPLLPDVFQVALVVPA